MRDIIQAEIDSPNPHRFLRPTRKDARAASAGVYILMGSDVAAMDSQTNLGAATPVSLTGDMDETMQAKVTNDAAALHLWVWPPLMGETPNGPSGAVRRSGFSAGGRST
jgi:membrane-bound serine protease (ClpP class)